MNWIFVMREWVTFAADISILLITTYTFYVTFISSKIRLLSISESLTTSDGNSFSVVIENKSFSPLVIEEVSLIIDNKYKVRVENFTSPLILEPFSAKKIESDRFSYMSPHVRIYFENNAALEVKTSRKTLYVRISKKTPRVSKEIKNIPYNVTKIKNTYNGKIVPEMAKYVLVVSKGEWTDTVFIFESGSMTGEIFGYNGIPMEFTKNQETLYNFIDEWLKPKEIKYQLEPVNKNM